MQVHRAEGIPNGLLETEPSALHTILHGPTMFRLEGERDDTLFVSTLLHGNEPTGFLALQKLLKQFQDKKPPRNLLVFLGNIEAAKENVRHLESQPDYNRIWNGVISPNINWPARSLTL